MAERARVIGPLVQTILEHVPGVERVAIEPYIDPEIPDTEGVTIRVTSSAEPDEAFDGYNLVHTCMLGEPRDGVAVVFDLI